MTKLNKMIIAGIGILLILNGIINIIDDSRVLAYDITALLAGLGFVQVSRSK